MTEGYRSPPPVVGDRYDSKMDVKDVAKLVRKDLAKAYPRKKGWKFSVRIDRYSMGCSLGVTVRAVPNSFAIYVDEWRAMVADHGRDAWTHWDRWPGRTNSDRFTNMAKRALEHMEEMVNRYNYRDIDSMTDYYNVSFSGGVNWDSELLRADEGKGDPTATPPVEPEPCAFCHEPKGSEDCRAMHRYAAGLKAEEAREFKRAKKDVADIFTTLEENTVREAAVMAAEKAGTELATHPGRPALRLVPPSKARSMPDPVTIEPKRPDWWPETPADPDVEFRSCLEVFIGG